MDKDRAVNIAKWAVLIAVVPVVLAVLMPRASNPPGNVKPVATRKTMPDFALRDLSGGAWKLSAHRGDVVLVNFWATWCEPCRNETPGLIRIAHRYAPKGLSVAGISMDEGGAAPVRKFLKDFGVNYPVMMPDPNFLLANEIENLPTTFLIDRQGRIAKTYIGGVSESVFRADIERLLAEPVS
jgi:cytochrome c biogenesis protein CcmG/thiol:disulfide interchange protein DsbE